MYCTGNLGDKLQSLNISFVIVSAVKYKVRERFNTIAYIFHYNMYMYRLTYGLVTLYGNGVQGSNGKYSVMWKCSDWSEAGTGTKTY